MKTIVMFISLTAMCVAFAHVSNYEYYPYDHTDGANLYATNQTVALNGGIVPVPQACQSLPENDTLSEIVVTGAQVTAVPCDDWDDAVAEYVPEANNPQASLGMKVSGSTCIWMARSGSGWVELDGAASEGTWDIKMEFDYSINPAKVRYLVRPAGNGDFIVLNASNPWMALASDVKRISGVDLSGVGSANSAVASSSARKAYAKITGVADASNYSPLTKAIRVVVGSPVYGSGLKLKVEATVNEAVISKEQSLQFGDNYIDIASLVGDAVNCQYKIYVISGGAGIPDSSSLAQVTLACNPQAPTVADGAITLNSNTDLKFDDQTLPVANGTYELSLNGHKLSWTDSNGKYAKRDGDTLTVVSGTPANGLSSYTSHVLGVSPEDEDAKPIMQSIPNADDGRLTFGIGNVGAIKTDEASVVCKLYSSDSPSVSTLDVTPVATGAGDGTVQVALPTNAEGVKYYKLQIEVIPK